MNNTEMQHELSPAAALDIAKRYKNAARLKAVPSVWFNVTIALLTSVLFMSVSYFGKLGLIVSPLFILVVFIQFMRVGVWPYFLLPSKEFVNQGVGELKHRPVVTVLLITGIFLVPFIFIGAQNLLLDGMTLAPAVIGLFVGAFVYLAADNSRKYKIKIYSNE